MRMFKRVSKPVGTAPGTLVHVGEKKVEKSTITVLDYDEAEVRESEVEAVAVCAAFKDSPTVTWINVEGLHEVETLRELGECFGLHPLALEDVLDTSQRPKIEDYDDYLYIVVRVLRYDEADDELRSEQLSLIVFRGAVISFQEGGGDIFGAVRMRIRANKGRIRKMGTDYLMYSLLDSVVDGCFVALEQMGGRIEALEEEVITDPKRSTMITIHRLREQTALLRRAIWPLREVVHFLERGETPLLQEATGIYVRDLYDHTIQVVETTESFRDLLSGMADMYLSSVSNRMNEVMKVLTIIATIFIPLTFIAGVYGMNFKYMPELKWIWGYPLVLGVMLAVAAVMLFYFRRKNWL